MPETSEPLAKTFLRFQTFLPQIQSNYVTENWLKAALLRSFQAYQTNLLSIVWDCCCIAGDMLRIWSRQLHCNLRACEKSTMQRHGPFQSQFRIVNNRSLNFTGWAWKVVADLDAGCVKASKGASLRMTLLKRQVTLLASECTNAKI